VLNRQSVPDDQNQEEKRTKGFQGEGVWIGRNMVKGGDELRRGIRTPITKGTEV